MSESDAIQADEQESAAATPVSRRPQAALPFFRYLAFGIMACLALLSIIWWRSEPQAMIPTATLVPTQWVAAAAPTSTARPTATVTPTDTATVTVPPSTPTQEPATASPADIALPTVTPTLATAQIATRTLEIGGQATLRVALRNDEFQSSGRPVPLTIESQTYILGADKPVIQDRWCFQAGVSALFFDLTLTLDQPTGTVDVDGEIQLHNGFCESPGAQTAVSPISLQVPADATAEVVHSLQADANLFGMGDLLQTSTGVFLELILRNPRLR